MRLGGGGAEGQPIFLYPHAHTPCPAVLRALDAAHAGRWSGLRPEEQWCAALASWRHPDVSWEPEAVAALGAGPGGAKQAAACKGLLTARLDAWRRALASAYTAVRHEQCPALYVVGPEVRGGWWRG